MKVALVHDWLTGMRGGERCLEVFLRLYPEADIFTLLHVPGSTSSMIDERVRRTSFLQHLPGVRRYYRMLLPVFPLAVRSFRFEGYDLVISLSHAAAKNINVPADIPHICYCLSPMRYIWDQARSYFGLATPALWPILRLLRRWDRRCSRGVRHFVAISKFVAARIRCFYGRESRVIYPPVDSAWIEPTRTSCSGAAFLLAGALVPYKRPDLAIEAFNRLGEPLWVVGKGPLLSKLKALAKPNIFFFGYLSDQELAGLYRSCRALIFPGTEDFGLIPIECMAAGRPVIGLDQGALRETVDGVRYWNDGAISSPAAAGSAPGSFVDSSHKSGVFIKRNCGAGREQQIQNMMESVRYFIQHELDFTVAACRRQAEKFSVERFREEWQEFLAAANFPVLPVETSARRERAEGEC